MFKSARIKLTLWYLLIITLVCLFFSLVVYNSLTSELNRIEKMQKERVERSLLQNNNNLRLPKPPYLNPEIIADAKNRIMIILTIINISILGSSAAAGYFLAGKTLKPIKNMIDEQDRFISDASHELRTPLTSLKTEIEVNLRDKKLTLEQAKKLLKSNLEETNHLQLLSDELIKLTQYQNVKNNILISKLLLSNLIKDAIKKVETLTKIKKITIENKANNYKIEGNKAMLIELFVILLDNAIKYSNKNSKIILTSKKTNENIEVTVKDYGLGIAKENIPYLFDRFYRADKSRNKSNIQGYGLGLSIAKKIIKQHKGIIKIESESKKGTEVLVKLPIKYS